MKKDFKEFKDFIKDKKVAVVGIGVSNIPLIHFLVKLHAKVTGFDKKTEEQLGDTAEDFKVLGVKLVLGENYLEGLNSFDVIFKTPSMRIDSPALVRAQSEGTYITSEMEEFMKYCPAKVFGITGSDGKTTTTTLVYQILKEEGHKTWVGGNIGTPLFSCIEEINPDDKVVLELSSFQLMTMTTSPQVSVVTNLSPNHLDIHKDMDEYIEAKKNIYKYADPMSTTVLNRDNAITNSFVNEIKGKVLQFSINENIEQGACFIDNELRIFGQKVCELEEVKLMGMYNVENLLAAFCAICNDASIDSMRKIATTFVGVEHRSEFVREVDGVKFYNNSIASSPTRTLANLKAFRKPVILIAGGYDKKLPFDVLAEEGIEMIKALVLLGATKEKIKEAFEQVLRQRSDKHLPIYITEGLEGAVQKVREIAETGDVVTLSPACASFDMFPNFEVRGNIFKEIVKGL